DEWVVAEHAGPRCGSGWSKGVADQRNTLDACSSNDEIYYRRMNVHTVGNESQHRFAFEQRTDQAGLPMVQGRHAIEQVSRKSSPRGEAGLRCREIGARVTQTDDDAAARQLLHGHQTAL